MKYKSWVIIFLMSLLLIGCSEKTDEEIFYKAQKQIVSMDTYICTADITIYGNKSPEKYTARQWFKAPDKYKIEIQSPEDLKGKITIYNGKRAWVCQPRIGQEWLMEDFSASIEQKIFLGQFLNNFVNTESTKMMRETIENKDYIVIQAEIPGNNPYFRKEKLWFDVNKYYPYKLQVVDEYNKIRIDVRYVEFKFNENLDDDIFTIKGDI